MFAFICWLTRPLIAKLSPLASSIAVSARRVIRPGTVTPPVSTPELKSSSETSGATLSAMRSPASTVGVTMSRIPNGLNSIVIEFPPPLLCVTGIGSSPPARKLAVCPGERDERRLGERVREPVLLEHADGDEQVLSACP